MVDIYSPSQVILVAHKPFRDANAVHNGVILMEFQAAVNGSAGALKISHEVAERGDLVC